MAAKHDEERNNVCSVCQCCVVISLLWETKTDHLKLPPHPAYKQANIYSNIHVFDPNKTVFFPILHAGRLPRGPQSRMKVRQGVKDMFLEINYVAALGCILLLGVQSVWH